MPALFDCYYIQKEDKKMDNRDLKKLALLGITGGLLISNTASAHDKKNFSTNIDVSLLLADNNTGQTSTNAAASASTASTSSNSSSDSNKGPNEYSSDPNDGNLGYHLMTEQELLLELNDEGIKLYKSLDDEGKELARFVASQRCQNSNKCKGLNACQTAKNACAGKGACKGQGKCAFSDKNLAVKVVATKMAEKRAKASN
jgi:hypothetical protein